MTAMTMPAIAPAPSPGSVRAPISGSVGVVVVRLVDSPEGYIKVV